MLSKSFFFILTNITTNYDANDCRTGDTNFTLYFKNALSLYWPKDLNFIYISRSYPPCVIEINITDIKNPFVSKIYQIKELGSSIIGLPLMAVNVNYILHSVYDVNSL